MGGSAVFWLMLLPASEPSPRSAGVRGRAVGFGHLTTAVLGLLAWMPLVTVWGPWPLARVWLPLTGRLPWPVMAFLADTHRRGVLRQAGGVYRVRHARLRDHLTAPR
ncbi:hypothetical protein [Actinokineospora iranica]|uniref:Uncharacterized protein n=1 Tax=Actinokineospora iranica TaxID=1271860 RepID=A0A1G6U8D9_9PSEU|nr:hypothetical protein [Actinokineospora iranica]SDD37541.1 hypothetical protein SAMN05216174_110157 [Actinokineospora iranica]